MLKLVPILEFAYRLGFTNLYDWQAKILLRYEAGEPTAAACANYSGKTSVLFPTAALWTLYSFPKARLMYMSATWLQVTNQFFAGLERFQGHRMFAGWQWLESEVRTPAGGFLFGRASDVSGYIEGIHDQYGSPAGLLVDEAKSIRDEVLDTLLNPQVIIEVLSESTEKYDRGAKFGMYRQLDSLREYVLVAQDRPLVERYVRQADGSWVLTEFNQMKQTFEFATVPARVALAEVYRGVSFPGPPEAGLSGSSSF